MPPTQQRQPEAKPDAGKRKKKAVSKDSGSYGNKDGMQPYTQLLHSVADYRRKWRTLVLLLVVLGLFFVALGVSLPWDTVSTSETYDPSVGLSLSLAGCDARLVSGSTATVTYHARRGVAPVTWVRPFAESSTVSEAHAHNTEWDCADAPLGLCSSWCRLTVEVPPGASSAAIQLLQPSGDASHPSVTIGNVTVGSITTAPANTPLPSLSLHLVHTTVLGATTIRLHEGGVHSVGSSLRGETRLVVSGGGSVRVHEVAAHERSLSVRYAQPQGLACFATDQPRAAISASWPWDECPVALQAPSLAAQLRARYDMDGDDKVSLAEFTGAAEALSCCGPHAPLSCSCTPEASALGLSATAVVTNGGLPLANFEDAIKNYNASGLVSYGSSHAGGATCLEGVTLAAGYSTPLATANLLELSSAHDDLGDRQQARGESGPGGAWTGLIAPDSCCTLRVGRSSRCRTRFYAPPLWWAGKGPHQGLLFLLRVLLGRHLRPRLHYLRRPLERGKAVATLGVLVIGCIPSHRPGTPRAALRLLDWPDHPPRACESCQRRLLPSVAASSHRISRFLDRIRVGNRRSPPRHRQDGGPRDVCPAARPPRRRAHRRARRSGGAARLSRDDSRFGRGRLAGGGLLRLLLLRLLRLLLLRLLRLLHLLGVQRQRRACVDQLALPDASIHLL